MRTCIYARKSTLKLGQKETVENQIKICKRYANEHDLEIVDIKTDTGTGTDDIHRPEVKELIDDAIKGKYECVIMKGVSRLYRDVANGLNLIKKLDRSGIRVITIEEMFDSLENRTSIGKLDLSKITMYLMFSEMESKKLADRVKHTQIEKAYAGQWNQASSVPFGYSYDKTTKKLKVDHSTSPIIKLIFDLYLKGMGMKTIAFYLNGDNEEGKQYPSPRSKRWSENTVSRILRNQVYVGDIVFNKRSKTERPYKSPEMLGKTADDVYIGNDYNDKEKWIITKNAHESIISEDVFQKVQEIAETKATRKGIRNNVSLLAGVSICQKCGSGMTFKRGNRNHLGHIKSRNNYYCANYISYGNQFCTSHHIRAEELEEAVINRLQELLKNKNKIGKIISKTKHKLPTDEKDYQKQKNSINKDIKDITDKMDKLLKKNMDGDIDDRQYKIMNSDYSEKLNYLSDELERIELEANKQDDTDERLERFKRHINEMVNFENKTKEEQRYIILNLIHAVIVYENGNKIRIIYKFEAE